MPFGPPGEWVPAAMISGTRDDTPGGKNRDITLLHTNPLTISGHKVKDSDQGQPYITGATKACFELN